jgi:hypothetical protein
MKKYLFVSMILLVSIAACKKGDTGPTGPQGQQGATGPQGPQGVAGNANVMQYTYGTQNFSTSASVQLQVTTTLDTMNRSQWFVYLYYQTGDRWLFVPGIGYSGDAQYRVSIGHVGGKANIRIDRGGVGEIYQKARVIRIYASGETTGGRMAVDFTNYEAVRKYYNLPD